MPDEYEQDVCAAWEQALKERDQFGKELCEVTAQVERLQDDIGRLEEALGAHEAFLRDLLEMDEYDEVGNLHNRARTLLETIGKERPSR